MTDPADREDDLLADYGARIRIPAGFPPRLDMREAAGVEAWKRIGPFDVLVDGQPIRHAVAYDVPRGRLVAYRTKANGQLWIVPGEGRIETIDVEGDVEIRAKAHNLEGK